MPVLFRLIVLIGIVLPGAALACPTADDLAAVGSQPGVLLDDCVEIESFIIPTGRGPVEAKLYSTAGTGERAIEYVKEALVRSGETLSRMGALSTEPIEIYLSPTPYVPTGTETAMAAAHPSIDIGPADGGETCVFAIFLPISVDDLRFTIAHEYFHCVQFFEFGDQYDQAGSDWWVESSAEWFASNVYQGTDRSDGFVAVFDSLSPDKAITKMTYPNLVFFWWLDQALGTEKVIELMRSMIGSSQEDALAGVISDDEFLRFAKDYLDGKIVQAGGRSIASSPDYGEEYRIEESKEQEFEAERFVLYRAVLKVSCGKWTTRESGLEGRYEVEKQPGSSWEALPAEIEPEGGSDIEYRIAAGGTEADGFKVKFEFEKEPCVPCEEPDFSEGPEACLVGEWTLASGGIGAKIGEMLEGNAGLEGVDYPDIDGRLSLQANGQFTLGADDDGEMSVRSPGGELFTADISFNLEKHGSWSIDGDHLIQCYLPPTRIEISETVTDPDDLSQTITENRFLGPELSYETKRTFNCTPGRLEITEKAFFAPTLHWVYEK